MITGLLAGVFLPTSVAAQVSHQDTGFTLSGGGIVQTAYRPAGIGPSMAGAVNYGIHPMWNVGGELQISMPVQFAHSENPHSLNGAQPYFSGGAFVGVSTIFDVLKVVPWIRVSGGTLLEPLYDHPDGNPNLRLNPALMLGLGVDVRKHRDHAWGAHMDVIAAARTEWEWARYVRFGVRYTWMKSKSAI